MKLKQLLFFASLFVIPFCTQIESPKEVVAELPPTDTFEFTPIEDVKPQFDEKKFRKEKWEVRKWISEKRNLDSFLFHEKAFTEKYHDFIVNQPKEKSYQYTFDLNYYHNDTITQIIEKGLSSNKIPTHLAHNAYEGIIKNKVRNGKFKEGIYWSEKWNKFSKDSIKNEKYEDLNSQVVLLQKFVNKIDSLKKINLPVDIELQKAIFLLEDFINSNYWFSGEAMKNYSLVYDMIDSFLITFPNSSVIEEVAFLKMNLDLIDGDCTPEFKPRHLQTFKRFIAKYPNGEKHIEAKLEMLAYYSIFAPYTDLKSNFIDTLNWAQKSFDSILIQHPKYKDKYEADIRNLKKLTFKTIWDFSLKSEKQIYQKGEPIYVTVALKNMTESPQEIILHETKNYPLFSLRGDQTIFQKSGEERQKRKVITIPSQESFIEKINLLERVKWNNSLGFLKFDHPKELKVKAAYYPPNSNFEIKSNYIFIDILDN